RPRPCRVRRGRGHGARRAGGAGGGHDGDRAAARPDARQRLRGRPPTGRFRGAHARAARRALESLHALTSALAQPKTRQDMGAEPMIDVRDLTKMFGAVEAIAGVSFRVARGEIVGFLGPNGAGKTTTMRILAGIFPPTSGEVRIAGRDLMRDSLACRAAVGYF